MSPFRLSILKKYITSHISRPSPTRWNFHIRNVNRVYENLEAIKKNLEEMQSTANADRTISGATGIFFTHFELCKLPLLVETFSSDNASQVIYNQMQSRTIDS